MQKAKFGISVLFRPNFISLYNPLPLSSINFLKLAGVLEGFPSNVEHNLPKKTLRNYIFQPTYMLLAF